MHAACCGILRHSGACCGKHDATCRAAPQRTAPHPAWTNRQPASLPVSSLAHVKCRPIVSYRTKFYSRGSQPGENSHMGNLNFRVHGGIYTTDWQTQTVGQLILADLGREELHSNVRRIRGPYGKKLGTTHLQSRKLNSNDSIVEYRRETEHRCRPTCTHVRQHI